VEFFNYFFSINYIVDIWLKALQECIYDFDEFKKKNENVVIWWIVKKFDQKRIEEYAKLMIIPFVKEWRVDVIFSKIYIPDSRWQDVPFDFNRDEFCAYIFTKWVRYWIGEAEEAEIKAWLMSKYSKKTIAKNLKSEKWNPAVLEMNLDLYPVKKPIEVSEKSRLDTKKFQCVFPQVSARIRDWLILTKVKPTAWKHWMSFDWAVIDGIIWDDKYNVQVMLGSWTRFDEDNERVYIKSTMSGFLDVEKEFEYWEKIPRPRKINVSENVVHNWPIWPETWSLEIISWRLFVQSKWNLEKDYELTCNNNIRFDQADAEWKVVSKTGNINIFWNTIAWKVIAEKWNVFIHGRAIMRSYIEALNWDIEIEYAEFCRIVGKNVKIKVAIWCEVIWETVEITESSNANHIVAKRSLVISGKMEAKPFKWSWDIVTKSKDTSVILLCKKEVIWDAKMLYKIKRALMYYENQKQLDEQTKAIIDDLNERAKSFLNSSKKSEEVHQDDIFVRMSAWDSIYDTKMYLWDFFESFDISLLNSKWEEYKDKFISLLLDLFDQHKHIWKILLSQMNFEKYSDMNWNVDMNFNSIKSLMNDELENRHFIPQAYREQNEWVDNRQERRLHILDQEEFEMKKLDFWNHSNIIVSVDEFTWAIKNLSWSWVCLYLRESDLWENHVFYNLWDYIENVSFNVMWKDFNLKAVIKSRFEKNWIIILGCQFFWMNDFKHSQLYWAVNMLEVTLYRNQKEHQQEADALK
jgi:hypothetical protein